jgi:hypothetical protein
MGTAILASFSATVLWIIAHLVAMHLRPAKGRMGAMAKAWLCSLPVLVIALYLINGDANLVAALNGKESGLLSWFYALLLHLLLFFLFVECFYHIERSVTLRLLVEIEASSASKPSINSIMRDYSVDDMIRRRLESMEQSGFIIKKDDRWVLSQKGATYAKIMGLSCWIFQSKPQNERL